VIALSLIEVAEEARRGWAGRVEALRLRVGAPSGVAPEALVFAFDEARRGPARAGRVAALSRLRGAGNRRATRTQMSARILEVRAGVLKKNDALAREQRARFAEAGVFVVDLVSGPGAGKTSLADSGAPVRQITTGTVCHLDAEMIARALEGWDLPALDFLFIENVGNLVCPASYDVGESARVVLHAVTEGEDKPVKYPTLYNSSDLAVITKIDLAAAVGFDRGQAVANMREVRPGLEVLDTSARTGAGLQEWTRRLEELRWRSLS
jgi:hydrogenase nickel incorporation protein HypB